MDRQIPLTSSETPATVNIVAADTVFQGYFRIDRYKLCHVTHAGGWTGIMTREIFERGHAVAVVPYDPWQDTVLLLEQFRIGALAGGKAAWQTEVVAGIIDSNETPEDVAHRETREEAGERLHGLIPVYHYLVSPGGTTETVRLYCGIVDSRKAGGLHGLAEEHEDIRVQVWPFAEAWARMSAGDLDNAPTIIAMQWLALNRARLCKDYTTI